MIDLTTDDEVFMDLMTAGGLSYDIDLNYLTINEKVLEKGKVYKLTIPQKSESDEYVYSITLISTVDKSEKLSII